MNLPTKLTVSRIVMSIFVIIIIFFLFFLFIFYFLKFFIIVFLLVSLFLIFVIIIMLFPFYAINVNFPRFYISDILVDSRYLIAGTLFIIASITDFLDGYIARKYGLITNTGKMLDAIADKVLVNSVLIILASTGFINAIIPVVIVLRDIIVNAIKMEAASRGKVIAAIGSGKLKTAALMVGIALTFFYNLPFELINIRVSDFLLYFATIMSIVSMIEYFNMNKKLIFDKKGDKN